MQELLLHNLCNSFCAALKADQCVFKNVMDRQKTNS